MFSFALLVGVYSYIIFSLGILGMLTKNNIYIATAIYFLILFVGYRKKLAIVLEASFLQKQIRLLGQFLWRDKIILLGCSLITIQALVNLIGALGPELAFDALWYHLTLPKIFLMDKSLHHIGGGLLYYSDMPKLGEMLFTAALAFDSEILAKMSQFAFGLMTVLAIYKVSRKFFDPRISILACVLFYANLVVAWESTTAYVDLIRTFFEIMAVRGFLNWLETKEKKWFIESACLVGLAIATKLIAIGTLVIFIFLIFIYSKNNKLSLLSSIKLAGEFCSIAVLISLPWFVLAFLSTGNPLYPLFSHYEIHQSLGEIINPLRLVTSMWQIFTHSPDPLAPLYILFSPLLFFKRTKLPKFFVYMYIYVGISLLVWYVTPQTGGGRFILAYLPVLSIVMISILTHHFARKFVFAIIMLIFFIASITVIYRGIANAKYIPVLVGRQSKDQFLTNHLNFDFGDFYDTDGYFKKHIKPHETILLYGFHNLYYVDFPFIDSSWVKKGDRFTYIAVKDTKLPERFKYWELKYHNPKTHVSLYTLTYHEWIY